VSTLLAVLTLLLMQVPQVVCQHGDTQARYSVLGSVCLIADAHEHTHHHNHHGAAHDHDHHHGHDHETHAHALVQAEVVHAGTAATLPPADASPSPLLCDMAGSSLLSPRAGVADGWTRVPRGVPPALPDDPVHRGTTLLL